MFIPKACGVASAFDAVLLIPLCLKTYAYGGRISTFISKSQTMGDFSKYLPSPTEILQAAKRHWVSGLIVAGALFAVAASGIYMLPREYESEAKLFVKLGWPSVTLDATAQTGQTVSFYESRENEINSIIEILRSQDVMDEVVNRIGIDAILHGLPIAATSAATKSVDSSMPDHRHELAVMRLQKTINIWAPKRSNVIGIHATASSPEIAQGIVQAVIAAYHEIHPKINSTAGSFEFFADQERVLRDKLETATTELRDAKDAMGVASLEGKRTMLQGELSNLEDRLLQAKSEIASSEARITSLKTKLNEVPKFTETSRAENANIATDNMRSSLYQLQMKQQEMQSRYTESHPQMIAVREQVAELTKLLGSESGLRVQSTSAINPSYQQLETSLLTESANLDSTRARENSLIAQRSDVLAQLKTLNHDEVKLSQLQQQVSMTEQSYRETSTRFEQARIQRELTSQRVSNVNLVQPASYVSKAVSPKRTMLLGVAAVASILSGAMSILGFAFLERKFRSLFDMAERLQLPVVASFPALSPAK